MRLLCLVALVVPGTSTSGPDIGKGLLLLDVADGLVDQSMEIFEELDLMGIEANPEKEYLVKWQVPQVLHRFANSKDFILSLVRSASVEPETFLERIHSDTHTFVNTFMDTIGDLFVRINPETDELKFKLKALEILYVDWSRWRTAAMAIKYTEDHVVRCAEIGSVMLGEIELVHRSVKHIRSTMERTDDIGTRVFFEDSIAKEIVAQMDASLEDVAFTGGLAFTEIFLTQLRSQTADLQRIGNMINTVRSCVKSILSLLPDRTDTLFLTSSKRG